MTGNSEEISAKINAVLDELGAHEDMREDLFQEAWVAHLEGKSVRAAVIHVIEKETFYKKVFGR